MHPHQQQPNEPLQQQLQLHPTTTTTPTTTTSEQHQQQQHHSSSAAAAQATAGPSEPLPPPTHTAAPAHSGTETGPPVTATTTATATATSSSSTSSSSCCCSTTAASSNDASAACCSTCSRSSSSSRSSSGSPSQPPRHGTSSTNSSSHEAPHTRPAAAAMSSIRRWKQLPPCLAPHAGRSKHTAVFHNKLMVVLGGHDPWTDTFLNDVLVYDTVTSTWLDVATDPRFARLRETHKEAPCARRAHSACMLGDHMIVFGGFSGKNCYSDVHTLNTTTWEWSRLACPASGARPPSGRGGHSCVASAADGVVYITGGWDTSLRYHNDVWRLTPDFDAKTVAWTELKPANPPAERPLGRVGHSCCLVDGRLVVFGGYGGDSYHNDLCVFDLAARRWSTLATDPRYKRPSPRNYHCAVLSPGGKLLLLGGAFENGLMDDVWLLDLKAALRQQQQQQQQQRSCKPPKAAWAELACPGAKRFAHSCVADPETGVVYIFGVAAADESNLLEFVVEDWHSPQTLAHYMTRFVSKHAAFRGSALQGLPPSAIAKLLSYRAELALPFSPVSPPFSQPSTPVQPRHPVTHILDASPLVL